MPPKFRLDPELAALNVMIPRFDFDDLPVARTLELALSEQGRTPTAGVVRTDVAVPRPGGGEVAVRMYRPVAAPPVLPALLYLHGGSFMLGGLHSEEERCELYAVTAGCVVVQVDYRLAPEHPFPAAYDDCRAALSWLAEEQGVDPDRIAVGGNSAGGALAAGLALESRSGDLPRVILQLLINPVLDHRSATASARQFVDSPVWTREDNLRMWAAYLSGSAGPIDERASPALATELRGAPATALWTAEFDPLRDEGLDFAIRLMHAGVPVSLQQYSGTIHGFDSYRMTRTGRRAFDDQILTLREAFAR